MSHGRVYHEVQVAALCGRHALNNLLQGPWVDEFALAEIARELDASERALMLSAGADTAEARAFLAEASGNVDDAGNFSLTVLREYLERAHRLTLVAEAGDVVLERIEAGGGEEAGLPHAAAEHFTDAQGAADEVAGAEEDGASGGAESFAETDGNAVEIFRQAALSGGEVGGTGGGSDGGIEKAGAVEVGGEAVVAG